MAFVAVDSVVVASAEGMVDKATVVTEVVGDVALLLPLSLLPAVYSAGPGMT